MTSFIIAAVIVIVVLIVIVRNIKIVPQAHAFIVERLGGYQNTWSVGIHFKVPIIDKVARKVLLKEQVMDYVLAHTRGKTVICVTHDRSDAAYLGGELTALKGISDEHSDEN